MRRRRRSDAKDRASRRDGKAEGGGRRGGGQRSRYTARERRNRLKHPGEELGVGRTPSI